MNVLEKPGGKTPNEFNFKKIKNNIINKIEMKGMGVLVAILPIFIWMICFFVIPIIFIIIISFFTRGEVGNIEKTLTLSNYKKLFDGVYINIFFKSMLLSIGTTLFCLVFGYPFAYFINKGSKKYAPLLILLVILPFWTNSLIRTYAWIILLRSEGIINSYLIKFHIIKEPLKLLYNNGAIIIGMVYMMLPFMVLPLYSSMEKLDKNLLEAANDLGASPYKTFFKVTLPLTLPGIISGCALVFVPTLGLFFISDLMGGSKTVLMSNLIKNQFLTARNWPFGSAISVVLICIMVIIISFYVKFGSKDDGGIM